MFGLIQKCFKKQSATEAWKNKVKEMAPSFGESLAKDENLVKATRERTSRVLKLH
jgi:malate dehydrogenase (quinone)